LAHRGACLSGRQVEWTFLQTDNAHSGGDRTAGDDDALASAMNELRHIRSETAKLFVIECVGARSSENAGAELEENASAFRGHAKLLYKLENESAQSLNCRKERLLVKAKRPDNKIRHGKGSPLTNDSRR
jgi:hypothetical protein